MNPEELLPFDFSKALSGRYDVFRILWDCEKPGLSYNKYKVLHFNKTKNGNLSFCYKDGDGVINSVLGYNNVDTLYLIPKKEPQFGDIIKVKDVVGDWVDSAFLYRNSKGNVVATEIDFKKSSGVRGFEFEEWKWPEEEEETTLDPNEYKVGLIPEGHQNKYDLEHYIKALIHQHNALVDYIKNNKT